MKTGLTVSVTDSSHNRATFVLSVIGDTNGDGNIDNSDFTQIEFLAVHGYISEISYSQASYRAADFTGDGVVDSADVFFARMAAS